MATSKSWIQKTWTLAGAVSAIACMAYLLSSTSWHSRQTSAVSIVERGHSNLTARWDPFTCAGNAWVDQSGNPHPPACEQAVIKGSELLCIIVAEEPRRSRFNDHDQLSADGWDSYSDDLKRGEFTTMGLKDAVLSLGIEDKKAKWQKISTTHARDTTIQGRVYPKTKHGRRFTDNY